MLPEIGNILVVLAKKQNHNYCGAAEGSSAVIYKFPRSIKSVYVTCSSSLGAIIETQRVYKPYYLLVRRR